MAIVTLITGSNLGNRYDNLSEAFTMLRELGDILTKSAFYQSEPWGFESQNEFLNQVLVISTRSNPYEILASIKNIEKRLGRLQKSIDGVYTDRLVDIDILFYDNEIIDHRPTLIIPHPQMASRKFVLKPLCEVAPDLVHPVLQKSVKQLLQECRDEMSVVPV